MKAKQILTDKEHYMTELEVFPAIKVARANALNIGTDANENFRGFGVAITGSSCYNLSIMEENERKGFLNKIYSDNGIGLSVGRLSIGSSDYSAEVYSYDDEPFDVELKHFPLNATKNTSYLW